MAKRLGEKKPTKRASKVPAKKATKVVKKVAKVEEVMMTPEVVNTPSKVSIKINKGMILRGIIYVLVFLVAFSAIDLFVQYLNNTYSVAVVNGTRISNNEFNDRLKKAYGASAIQAIIDEELIIQEGAKKNIEVTEEEIKAELALIEEQIGGKEALDQALITNGLTMEDLERQIRIKLIKVEILKPTITYTDEDLKKFFDTNKEYLYEEGAKFEDKKDDVTSKYVEQQVDAKQSTWIVEVREGSKIQNNITEKPKYGILKTTINIVSNLYNNITKK